MSGIDNFNAGETPHAVIIAGSMAADGTVTEGGVAVAPGVDSTGLPLPANFDNLQRNFTYNGDNTVATEYRTDGVNTWTKTYTYVSGNVTAISQWVKS